MTDRLASEDVIINAPMSYAGSAQRISRLRRLVAKQHIVLRILFAWLIIWPLILIAWAAVTCWYFIFGLWLVPYRVLRRGARKRKAEALRHRELLGTIASQNTPVAPPQPYRDPALDRALSAANATSTPLLEKAPSNTSALADAELSPRAARIAPAMSPCSKRRWVSSLVC